MFLDRRYVWWSLLGLETILVLSPLLTTEYPPLSDLINHMARVYIIADAGRDPTLAAMYTPVWHVIPNLAVDLIGPDLVKLTSVSIAGRLLLAFGIILCLFGTIALHRATFRTRSYWPLGVGLILYNAELLLGFINFIIGMGVALLAGAAVMSKARSLEKIRLSLSCVAAVVIFFCHGWALIFYFVLLGVHEVLDLQSRAKPMQLGHLIRSALRLGLPALVPVLLVYFFTPHANFDVAIMWGNLRQHLRMAISPFINYSPGFDVATGVFVLCVVVALTFRKTLWIPLSTSLTLAILALLFIFCPYGMSGAFFLSSRLALFIAFMLFAGICPRDHRFDRWKLPAGLLALFLVVRIAFVGEVWYSSRHDLADFRSLGESISPGSRVLATQVNEDENPIGFSRDQPRSRQLRGMLSNVWYLPSLWVIERHAFFPLLFTNPSLQPLEVARGYRDLSVPFGIPPDYRALFDIDLAAQEMNGSPFLKGSRYLADWERHFDYVVVLNAGRAEHLDKLDALPLALIGKTDIAALYRVLR